MEQGRVEMDNRFGELPVQNTTGGGVPRPVPWMDYDALLLPVQKRDEFGKLPVQKPIGTEA